MSFLNMISGVTAFNVIFIISMCFIPVFIWMIVASIRVNTVFATYNKVQAKSRYTGAEVARMILNEAGLYNVRVEPCKGHLTDHYDPRCDVVYLSESSFSSSSVAALGVAAHEVGHAVQYARNYVPVKLRTALVPALNFASKLSIPLLLIAIMIEIFIGINPVSNVFLGFAVGFYALYAIFSLITLPVEFNASSRAKKLLTECGALDSEEVRGASKVLGAAAQTYLASFAVSLVQLARMLFLLLLRRGSSDR